MVIKPWKVLETTDLLPDIHVDKCELPNGQMITPHVLDYDDEIMVLPLTKDRHVVLIRQYRHGVQDVILELPSGSVDKGETPLEAAKRELTEETGYVSDSLITLGQFSPNPAIYRNKLHIFLALDAEQSGKQSAHDVDSIEVRLMPLEEVIAEARAGKLINSLNITTLFFVLDYLQRIS